MNEVELFEDLLKIEGYRELIFKFTCICRGRRAGGQEFSLIGRNHWIIIKGVAQEKP